jgi:epoxyqueuosine reductase QueG
LEAGREILGEARALFDVAGVGRLPDGRYLLILGLESGPERDLDDFGHTAGGFQMYGFQKHAAPKLESLLGFIRGRGFKAGLIGRFGYPLKGEVSLKREAIRAGLGKRGKNTVVLHPVYGPRLRFMAVGTDAPLGPLAGPPVLEEPSPFCENCSVCVDACPVNVLEPYRMLDPSVCLSNVSPVAEDGHSILCDICLKKCPAGDNK